MTFEEAHRAIKRGNLSSIRVALEAGMSPNLSNKFGWTLIMLAAMAGNSKFGELLIEHGAELDPVNNAGETALSLAAHAGHARFVELLTTRGASVECQPHGHSLEDWMVNTSGLPPDKVADILILIEKHRRQRGTQ